jgi:hypothetical protein
LGLILENTPLNAFLFLHGLSSGVCAIFYHSQNFFILT